MMLLSGNRSLSIRATVGIALAIVLAVTGAVIYGTYNTLREASSVHARIVAYSNQTVLLEDVRAEYLNEWLALTSTPQVGEGMVARFNASRDRVESALTGLKENSAAIGPTEEARIARLANEHEDLARTWEPIVGLLREGRSDEAEAIMQRGLFRASTGFVDRVGVQIALDRDSLNQLLGQTGEARDRWRQAALLLMAFWLTLIAVGLYFAERGVLKPLDDLGRATRAIASGDASTVAPVSGPFEISALARDVNLMAASLIQRSRQLNDYLEKDLEKRTAELEHMNAALRESEARLSAVIESAPLILFALDRSGWFTLTRGKGLEAIGAGPGGGDGRSIEELFPASSPVRAAVGRALAGETVTLEVPFGSSIFESHMSPMWSPDGEIEGVIGVAVDVTESRRAEQALRRSEVRYRELFENANDVIYTHDLEGHFTSINKAGQRLSGYSEAEFLNMRISDLLPPESLEKALQMLGMKLDGIAATTTYEVEVAAKDGSPVPLEISSRVIYEKGEPAAIQGIARDVGDRRRAELALKRHADDLEALYQQLSAAHEKLAESQTALEEKSRLLERSLEIERARSRVDPLTGALNHGGIVAELRALTEAGEPAAVFMLDIDGMKAANDLYGHPFGDRVLCAVKDALTRDAAVIGRYGGDEFVAVLKGAGQQEAEMYRKTVLAALADPGLKDPQSGDEVHVIASIGFSLYPRDGRAVEELIAVADAAMYAHRRQSTAAGAVTRRMGGDRVLQLVGEIVPVLTSPGDQREQLGLVCERLAVDRGYDGVELMINPYLAEGRETVVAYPPIPSEYQASWARAREPYYRSEHPLSSLLGRTGRPVIIDRAQDDERLVPFQRTLLRVTGLRSLMIAPLSWEGKLIGSMTAASKRESAFGPADAQILMSVASQVTSIVSMTSLVQEFRKQVQRLGRARSNGVRLLGSIVETQSGSLGHDLDRLAAIAEALAGKLGFGEEESAEIGLAAMLHDVGKYAVPAHILGQPDDLSADDFELVKTHSLSGWELLRHVPGFELAAQVARWHHERWDGHGYPDGFAGDEIPLQVAIASVADALDAMIYDRVYSHSMAPEAALNEVIAASGSHFSPIVVRALVQLRDEGLLPPDLREPQADQPQPDQRLAA